MVRVSPDLTRSLVRLDARGNVGETLFPNLANLGAYLWIDDDRVALFTGDKNGTQLMLGDVHTGAVQPIADNVSAAMALMPGSRAISFVDQTDEHARLMRFDLSTHAITPIMAVPDGVEKFAWLADESVLYGDGTKLVRASAAQPTPHELIDFRGAIIGAITRVTVSGNRIALVVHAP